MALNQEFLNNLYQTNKSLSSKVEENATPPSSEQVLQLPIDQLAEFPTSRYNRYRIHKGEKMQELTESIRHNGVLDPLVVRAIGDNRYEIISGKNRKRAAKSIGYETLPCIIRALDDDEALQQLNFLNAQYRELLPSEKAFAYELEHQQSNNHGFRSDLTLYQRDTKLEETDGRMTKWRYRQLTKFVNDGFLDAVDNNLIKLGAAVEIAGLSPISQQTVYDFFLHVIEIDVLYRDERHQITPEMATEIKAMEEHGDKITADSLSLLFKVKEVKAPSGVLKLQMKKLRTRYPALSSMRPYEIEDTIEKALTEYFERRKERHHNE